MMWIKWVLLLALVSFVMAAPNRIDLLQKDQELEESKLFPMASEEMSAEASALLSALIRADMESRREEKLAKRREYIDKEDDWLWVNPSEPETDYLSSRRRLYPAMLVPELTTAASVDGGEDEQEMYLQLDKRRAMLQRQRTINNNDNNNNNDNLDDVDKDEEELELLRLRDQGRLPLV